MISIKRVIPREIKAAIWKLASKHLHLERVLASGYKIRISSYADWCIYNDIFVEGEYDLAIDAALQGLTTRVHFRLVDLGANVGFFILRVLDRMRRRFETPLRTSILCVEASPSLKVELEARVGTTRDERTSVTIVTGLVGEQTGSATLEFASSEVMNRISRDASSGPRLPFVDLDMFLYDIEEIDLLKCDIEGSESKFLRNYSGILRRARVAVFEFHQPECALEPEMRALKEAGFSRSTLLLDQGMARTVLFER